MSTKSESWVWKYFFKSDDRMSASCTLCGKVLQNKGSTSTLSRHLGKVRHFKKNMVEQQDNW